jgi:uncharacterized membrane protein
MEREQEESTMSKEKFSSTGRLTFMAIMLAMTIVFVMATVIPNFAVSMAVAMFLPTILTGIVLGAKEGMVMGALAGALTLFRALFLPLSPFDYFFINPLVSVFPRIFIGVAATVAFYLFNVKLKVPEIISASISGAFAMFTNTVLVVTMLYVVHGQNMIDAMGGMGLVTALGVLFASNGLIEMISAALIVPILYRVFIQYSRK